MAFHCPDAPVRGTVNHQYAGLLRWPPDTVTIERVMLECARLARSATVEGSRHGRIGRRRDQGSFDDANHAFVAVAGEVDMATVASVQDNMSVLADGQLPTSRVTLDMSGIEFIDASGVRVLQGLSQRAHECGRELRLTHPSRTVRRILDILAERVELTIDDETTYPANNGPDIRHIVNGHDVDRTGGLA